MVSPNETERQLAQLVINYNHHKRANWLKDLKTMSTQIQNTDEAFNALLREWIGKLVLCEKKNGKRFTAKLIAVKGTHLIFENRKGNQFMDSISSLETAQALEFMPEEKAVFEEMERGYSPEPSPDAFREAYKALPILLTCEQAEAAARARKGL